MEFSWNFLLSYLLFLDLNKSPRLKGNGTYLSVIIHKIIKAFLEHGAYPGH